jgi:hypothetical protein
VWLHRGFDAFFTRIIPLLSYRVGNALDSPDEIVHVHGVMTGGTLTVGLTDAPLRSGQACSAPPAQLHIRALACGDRYGSRIGNWPRRFKS